MDLLINSLLGKRDHAKGMSKRVILSQDIDISMNESDEAYHR